MYDFCSPELKKSLDLGREFETKMREEEDKAKLAGEDVEMKDENEESKVTKKINK